MERIDALRETLRERYPAYSLVVPGDPSFVCQASSCEALCCHRFSVPVSEAGAGRMERSSGLPRRAFLECEDGVPIALPMVEPYLLRRSDGHCSLLRADMACGQYEGRPDACRLYPHQVLFLDSTGMPQETLPRGEAEPLLIRHNDCPGFTGPPLTPDEHHATLRATATMQYGPGVNAVVESR